MANATPQRILIVTPRFPYPGQGACEKDRIGSMQQLVRLGYEVHVLTKVFSFQDKEAILRYAKELGIVLRMVPMESERKRSFGKLFVFHARRLRHLGYLDGAAYEYSHASMQSVFVDELENARPDIVWFDYTYLWPLYLLARKRGIPIITRSVNYEPEHFLDEDGCTLWNNLRAMPKYISERIVVRRSDYLFAITPREEKIYQRLGARALATLPLRDLAQYAGKVHTIRENIPLHVVFMGSTYTVRHNREALRFLVTQLAPAAETEFPGAFVFHVLGTKLPPEFLHYFTATVVYEPQSAEELSAFLDDMDIAVVPSFFGAGMQQKVFEPMTRGIPTIASPRAIAEYPLRSGEHFLAAETLSEYLQALADLRDPSARREISARATHATKVLFTWEHYDALIVNAFALVCGTRKM